MSLHKNCFSREAKINRSPKSFAREKVLPTERFPKLIHCFWSDSWICAVKKHRLCVRHGLTSFFENAAMNLSYISTKNISEKSNHKTDFILISTLFSDTIRRGKLELIQDFVTEFRKPSKKVQSGMNVSVTSINKIVENVSKNVSAVELLFDNNSRVRIPQQKHPSNQTKKWGHYDGQGRNARNLKLD